MKNLPLLATLITAAFASGAFAQTKKPGAMTRWTAVQNVPAIQDIRRDWS